ncbi:MAG: hypothetical protein NWE88_00715, partial [Candidatus Bathyarchaeota archaeon]|nr:hypothetical protein [Candidatus Bathyarchaeota archaeon]
MRESWEKDAGKPNECPSVEAKRGRGVILRLTMGADVYLALQPLTFFFGWSPDSLKSWLGRSPTSFVSPTLGDGDERIRFYHAVLSDDGRFYGVTRRLGDLKGQCSLNLREASNCRVLQ